MPPRPAACTGRHRKLLGLIALAAALLSPAAQANGWEHGAIPFEALVTGLRQGDAATRRQAAISLGHRGDGRAIAPLLAALQRPESEAEVREAAWLSLGLLGRPREPGMPGASQAADAATRSAAEQALRDCPRRETRPELQAACATALGDWDSPGALQTLLQLVNAADAPVLVRARSVDALGRRGDAQAVAALARIAAGNVPALRPRAVAALGRTRHPDAAAPLLQALKAATDDGERLRAVQALAQIGAPAAAEPLSELLRTASAPALRYELTTALAAVRGADLREVLTRQLADPTPAVRLAAIDGLRLQAARSAVPALAALAARELDTLAAMQKTASGEATGSVPDPLPMVAQAGLAAAALQAIHELDAPTGSTVLLRAARWPVPGAQASPALANAVYQLRRVAWYGLGYARSAEARQWLSSPAVLRDEDARLRAVAVRSLGVLGAGEVLLQQPGLWRDDEAEVRWTVAEVAGLGRVAKAEPQLLRLLDDPHALVRKAAVDALGWLRAGGAAARLRQVQSKDVDERVRAAAGLALAQISAPATVGPTAAQTARHP